MQFLEKLMLPVAILVLAYTVHDFTKAYERTNRYIAIPRVNEAVFIHDTKNHTITATTPDVKSASSLLYEFRYKAIRKSPLLEHLEKEFADELNKSTQGIFKDLDDEIQRMEKERKKLKLY